jgi:hypothetical protein
VPKHDNWRNYERAVEDATHDLLALGSCLDSADDTHPGELFAQAVLAEYALGDPLCALQEAQTWHQARSALLFWQQRWARAEEFVASAIAATHTNSTLRATGLVACALELGHTNHCLAFVLAELNARVVAFRDIRPQSAGAAARIAYMEHRHN